MGILAYFDSIHLANEISYQLILKVKSLEIVFQIQKHQNIGVFKENFKVGCHIGKWQTIFIKLIKEGTNEHRVSNRWNGLISNLIIYRV